MIYKKYKLNLSKTYKLTEKVKKHFPGVNVTAVTIHIIFDKYLYPYIIIFLHVIFLEYVKLTIYCAWYWNYVPWPIFRQKINCYGLFEMFFLRFRCCRYENVVSLFRQLVKHYKTIKCVLNIQVHKIKTLINTARSYYYKILIGHLPYLCSKS